MRLLIILFLFPFVSFGQNEIGFDPIDFTYINFVIDDKDASKSERFVEGVLWVTENFNSYNNVVSYQDKEEGIIIGSGNIRIDPNCRICGASGIHKTYAGWVSFTFKLEFFDDGYSYEFYNFIHKAEYSGGELRDSEPDASKLLMSPQAWDSIKDQVGLKASTTVKSLVDFMSLGT